MSDAREHPAGEGAAPPPVLAGTEVGDAFALIAELTQCLADGLDDDATLARALERIVQHVGAEAGSVWLTDEARSELVCHAQVGPPGDMIGTRLPLDTGIVGRSVRQNACQLVADARSDPHFYDGVDRRSGFATRSLVCAPLSFSDRALGAIQLVNKRGADPHFSENDRAIVRLLACSAALALANARMASQAVDHERVRRDLELASEIQRSLLPRARPESFPVFGMNEPARGVSGDFFDILTLDDRRVAFCLGDVSGKGLNAALLATKTASLYRYLTRTMAEPGVVLATLNDELAQTATRGMFVTMTAGVLHLERGVVTLASAGHEPALLHDGSGRFTSIPAQAPPLAVLPEQAFPESELHLHGGTLYVFSDGLTEAGPPDRPLGASGVERLIERFAAEPLPKRVGAVLRHVRQLRHPDDLTLVAVSAEEPSSR